MEVESLTEYVHSAGVCPETRANTLGCILQQKIVLLTIPNYLKYEYHRIVKQKGLPNFSLSFSSSANFINLFTVALNSSSFNVVGPPIFFPHIKGNLRGQTNQRSFWRAWCFYGRKGLGTLIIAPLTNNHNIQKTNPTANENYAQRIWLCWQWALTQDTIRRLENSRIRREILL